MSLISGNKTKEGFEKVYKYTWTYSYTSKVNIISHNVPNATISKIEAERWDGMYFYKMIATGTGT